MPDEGIHLAAALQLADARHVIATLWQTVDHDLVKNSPSAAELIYSQLVTDGVLRPEMAPYAMNHAIRKLRSDFPHQPTVWAPYMHFGP